MSTPEHKAPLHLADLLALCFGAMDPQVLVATFAAGLATVGPQGAAVSARPLEVVSVQDAAAAIAEARRAAHEVGDVIWAAKDAEDLDDILDASLDDERLEQLVEVVAFQLHNIMEIQGLSWLRAVRAKGASSYVENQMLYAGHISTRLMTIEPPPTDVPRHQRKANLAIAPKEMMLALLDSVRSINCFIAMLDLAMSDRRPSPYMIDRVAERWANGSMSYLRMVAMVQDRNDVLRGIDPPRNWLNRDDIFRRYSDREKTIANQLVAAVPRHWAVLAAARSAAVEIDEAAKRYAPGRDLSPIDITEDDDGSILVEWILKGRRIGITFAPKRTEGGWYYASSEEFGKEFVVGKLPNINVEFLVRKALMAG